MATIITRSGKGLPLTNTEVDNNFTNLNTDKVEKSGDSMTGNLSFGDLDKAIFGAGSDLQIYHDGSNSWLRNFGAGSLYVAGDTDGDVFIQGKAGENSVACYNDGAVALYYDNLPKLATTSTGIDVTGTVTADGLTVTAPNSQDLGDIVVTRTSTGTYPVGISMLDDGGIRGARIESGLNSIKYLAGSDGTTNYIGTAYHQFYGGSTLRMQVDGGSGDISFYEDTGTTAKFQWSASNEKLTLSTSGAAALDVRASATASATMALFSNSSGSDKAAIRLDSTGDGELVLIDAGNNEDVVITAGGNSYFNGGNVGIGTSSPNATLELGGTATPTIRLEESGAGSKRLELSIDSSSVGRIKANQSGGTIAFDTLSTERMRIDSSGNVGIGTSSPNAKVEIVNTSAGAVATQLFLHNASDTDGTGARLDFAGLSSGTIPTGSISNIRTGAGAYALTFSSYGGGSNAERMRIDSSGNLLVGKTLASKDIVGTELRPDGRINATGVSLDPLLLNRKTTDGAIATFQKDNTTVGSIGVNGTITEITAAGVDQQLSLIATNSSGVTKAARWEASNIQNGTFRPDVDAVSSLGLTNRRWNNLYLSGGVYLGGTGSANYLDDYETGTFTPTFTASTTNPTCTYDVQLGSYVKVGDLVFVIIELGTDAVSGGSGNLRLSGLPFTSKTGITVYNQTTAWNWVDNPVTSVLVANVNYVQFWDAGTVIITTSDMGTGANANRVRLAFSYQTA